MTSLPFSTNHHPGNSKTADLFPLSTNCPKVSHSVTLYYCPEKGVYRINDRAFARWMTEYRQCPFTGTGLTLTDPLDLKAKRKLKSTTPKEYTFIFICEDTHAVQLELINIPASVLSYGFHRGQTQKNYVTSGCHCLESLYQFKAFKEGR